MPVSSDPTNSSNHFSSIISMLAFGISALSYFAATRARRITQLSNELSKMPAVMPETRTNKRSGTVGLLLKNRGTGPAVIKSLIVTHNPNVSVDAAQTNNWLGDLQAELKSRAAAGKDVREIKENIKPVKQVLTSSIARGSVINVGEEFWLLKGEVGKETDDEIKMIAAWARNLTLRIQYSSVYLQEFDSDESYEKYIKEIHDKYGASLLPKWMKQLPLW